MRSRFFTYGLQDGTPIMHDSSFPELHDVDGAAGVPDETELLDEWIDGVSRCADACARVSAICWR